MSEIKTTFMLPTLPGIRRDGTMTDGDNYNDGQWVRWVRGRVRKMNGMRQAANYMSGPSRALFVWSQGLLNNITSYHPYGIDQISVDQNGVGGTSVDRTPAGFTSDVDLLWTVGQMYDAAGGNSLLLAQPSRTATLIDDDTTYPLYIGDPALGTAFTVADAVNAVSSGGVFATDPYAVLYGSDGYVKWSDANQPKTYTSGDAGSARVTGMKIVKGLPMRTGSGPGGLLWSLDSVIRMDYIGGAAIFRFSTISPKSSILAQNSVIEYDGNYYWIGIDRFMVSNGSQVAELPNQMNINWFFENLNYTQRQKVWAYKYPRFGEIWWFFPFGDATECTNAVIYNVREKTWYDVTLARSAGYSSQVFRYPVMANSGPETGILLNLAAIVGTFNSGDIVQGVLSGARGAVVSIGGSTLVLGNSSATSFSNGEGIVDMTTGATATISSHRSLYDIYVHEYGWNFIEGDQETAIQAYFETNDFGLPTGGTQTGAQAGLNRWTRLVRVEPDFIMDGNMTMNVVGREFPQGADTVSNGYTFGPSDGKIDTREQFRSIRLRFESNEVGGHFEAGKIILHTEPGDVRS